MRGHGIETEQGRLMGGREDKEEMLGLCYNLTHTLLKIYNTTHLGGGRVSLCIPGWTKAM